MIDLIFKAIELFFTAIAKGSWVSVLIVSLLIVLIIIFIATNRSSFQDYGTSAKKGV
jgi:uncharacterized integral membrane protein